MKNLANSVHARLARLRAGTGEDYNVLLVRFALERLLYRLSLSPYREQFILKGAMLFALWEPTLHRVTRDLDLLGFGEPSAERLNTIFRQVCGIAVEADGVSYDVPSVMCEDIRAQDEYAGIRVKLTARIGAAVIPLQVDIGFGDALPDGPEEIIFPVLLDMPSPKLRAYKRETVVSEKLEAIVRFGMLNSRLKDYFDLHYLAGKYEFDGNLLVKSIAATFERRRTSFSAGLPIGLTLEFSLDSVKARNWQAFWLKTGLKTQPPSLADTIDLIAKFLKQPLEAAAKGLRLDATWNSGSWFPNKGEGPL